MTHRVLRVGDRWTDGKRIGRLIGGADGKLVQIRLNSGELLELSERYFLRQFVRCEYPG